MKKIIYFFLTVSLIFSSCKKEEDEVVTPTVINGCTDSDATNYSASATNDDGSCTYYITGIWSVDDYILNGTSLFSPSSVLYITSMAININSDGTTWTLVYYSDGTELNVYGVWSLIGASILRLTNSDGDTVDWTITKLNGSECEIYANDLGGMGPGIIKLSRT